MKELEKPTHLGSYKCRKCKGDKFRWVNAKWNIKNLKDKTVSHYWTRTCVPCRDASEARYKNSANMPLYQQKYQQRRKQHLREYQREYYKGKHKQRNCINARRLRERTLPNEDLSLIKEFYLQCPNGHEVDHIIPLNGKNISGLHTLSNLQYLPASDNRRKSNKF